MIKLQPKHIAQILNTILRLTTLVAKLGLTLYMGRYFNLADIGTYGLVFGAVMVLAIVLGMRFDYVVSREVVGTTPAVVLAKMRDQAAFCGINYLILAVVMAVLVATDATGIPAKVMLIIFVLSVVESVASTTYNNITSLGHPLLANILFFIRSGSWAILIAIVGFLFPAFRTADAVLTSWIIGTTASLVVTLWTWRDLPWGKVMRTPVDWVWVRKGVARCFFIWLGAIGTTAGFYADRFVIASNLGLDLAGVVTFYASFTATLMTLVQSGVLAFAYPRLIVFYRENKMDAFWHEVRSSAWHVALFATVVALGIGVCVPLLGRFFHRPLLASETPTLWLMLIGMWLQSNALTLYYILFARHQDRAIWLGGLLYLIPAFGCNAVLVPIFGFIGIGYGAVISSLFLLGWRLWFVRIGPQTPTMAQPSLFL